jgi:hypothetical protein
LIEIEQPMPIDERKGDRDQDRFGSANQILSQSDADRRSAFAPVMRFMMRQPSDEIFENHEADGRSHRHEAQVRAQRRYEIGHGRTLDWVEAVGGGMDPWAMPPPDRAVVSA